MKERIDNFRVDSKMEDEHHGYDDKALVSTLVECFICDKETRLNKKPFHGMFQSQEGFKVELKGADASCCQVAEL